MLFKIVLNKPILVIYPGQQPLDAKYPKQITVQAPCLITAPFLKAAQGLAGKS
jgi:hypothetical protein